MNQFQMLFAGFLIIEIEIKAFIYKIKGILNYK